MLTLDKILFFRYTKHMEVIDLARERAARTMVLVQSGESSPEQRALAQRDGVSRDLKPTNALAIARKLQARYGKLADAGPRLMTPPE